MVMHCLSSAYEVFRQSTSTRFSHTCSPSSAGILYIYNWYVLCLSVDCLLAWFHPNQPNRQLTERHSTYQLYIYSIPADDGLQVRPKHVEVDWRNELRINSASGWFSLHGCIEMHGEQNIKFNSLSAWLSDQNFVTVYLLHEFLEGSKVGRVIIKVIQSISWYSSAFS